MIKNKINKNQKESLIDNYQKIKNDLDQNSMNGSLLNNSINNNSSMVQLMNKNNNKDIMNELKNAKKSANRIKKGKKRGTLEPIQEELLKLKDENTQLKKYLGGGNNVNRIQELIVENNNLRMKTLEILEQK